MDEQRAIQAATAALREAAARNPRFNPIAELSLEHVAELGKGGMGTVSKVRDRRLGRTAALKLIRGEVHADSVERFWREAQITAQLDHPSIPPVYDANASAAAQEIRGLRKAYERSVEARQGATEVGRSIGPDEIEGAVEVLQTIADGTPWQEAGIPGMNTIALIHDIRSYYEEAAMQLVDGPPPAGRAAEAWFYEQTETGKVVMAARTAIKDADGPFPVWFYMAPGHR